MPALKAIETHYKGYRFRSRIEARWAVFMDAIKIPWEYEREGFDLGADGNYLPDFWLPTQKEWVEIKGEKPSADEMRKATALAEASKCAVHLFWGRVEPDPFWVNMQEHGQWGGITIRPSCACGQLKRGLHAKWTSWLLCHACDTPHVSDTAPSCPCRPRWYHCKLDRDQAGTYPRCYLDAAGKRRRCHHDAALDRAYIAAKAARFEHDEKSKRTSSAQSSYDRRLDGWATKVYGEDWECDPGWEAASLRFDSWLESRGDD